MESVPRRDLVETLLGQIDARADELVSLCCELIRAPSENPPGDCWQVNDVLAEYLGARGIEVKRHVSPGGRESFTATLPASPVRRMAAGGGPCQPGGLVLCGHSDVVPAGDPGLWSFPPFAGDVEGGFIRGRGASDMKCGLAGLVFVMGLLARHRDEIVRPVTLAAVADEETGGEEGAGWLLEEGLAGGEACLIGEPTSPDHPTIGQKGACWFEVRLKGLAAHGSLAPMAGRNAIVLACRAVLALQRLWDLTSTPPPELERLISASTAYADASPYGEAFRRVTVNVGTVKGGTKINMVPDLCALEVDTRVPFGLEPEDVLRRADQLLTGEAGLSRDDFEVVPIGFQGSPNYTSPSTPVVSRLLEAIQAVRTRGKEGVAGRLGRPQGVLQWACSDARHFRTFGIPVVQYGPECLQTIHGVDERVGVREVLEAARVYCVFASSFAFGAD